MDISQKRILHLIDNPEFGGAQTEVMNIISAQGAQWLVFVLRSSGEAVIRITHPNIFISSSKSRFSPYPLFALVDMLKSKNISILHCHLFRSQVFGWLAKVLFCHRIILIFHEHGRIMGSENLNIIEPFLYRLFLRFSKHQVNMFFTCSKSVKNELAEKAGISAFKVAVVYNAINFGLYHNASDSKVSKRSSYGLPEKSFVIGFAARLIKRKGWRLFLEAAKRMKAIPEMMFVIAGTGPDLKDVKTAINEFGLTLKVKCLGYIDNMPDFYKLLDCFVIPSEWEPMGITAIEAQAAEIPLVASDVNGLNELVSDGETGFLFKSGNIDSLLAKIELVYKNKDMREKIVKKGVINAKQYSVDQHVKQILSYYNEILTTSA